MSSPRASTEDVRAPLLQRAVRDDDGEEGSVTRGDDFDRRSVKDVLMHPALLTGLEQALVVLSVALLCAAAVFGGLALGQTDKLKHLKEAPPVYTTKTATVTHSYTTTASPTGTAIPVPPREPPSKNEETCLTPVCVQVSAAILDSIDPSIDPCDDFYQFATGGWLAAHPIPPAKGLFGTAQWIDQRNKDTLLKILESPLSDTLKDDPVSTEEEQAAKEADRQNLKDLYGFFSMCMDEDALDRRGSAPLLEVVQEVLDAWRPKTSAETQGKGSSTRSQRLTDTLLLLHSKGIDAIFGSHVEGDYVVDPKTLRLWLDQGGLGLPDPEYYQDEATLKVYKEVIRSAVSDTLDRADYLEEERSGKKHKKPKKGKQPPKSQIDFAKVVGFEEQLAKISVDGAFLEDPVLVYNAYNLTSLARLAPFMSWTDYFSGFAPRNAPSPSIVTAPTFFGNLSSVLDKTDDLTLEAYFVWTAIKRLGPLLGPRERARKEVTQLQNYLSGIESGVRASRQDTCLQSVLDNYGNLMGRYFIKKSFPNESKVYVETIIKSTIKAFKDRLPELDWLDADARKAAKEKADAIGIKIGYPTSPNVTDPVALRAYYAANRPIRDQYFESVLNTRIVDNKRKWFSVGKPRNPGEWDMIPSEVNAYYQPSANEMAFPAGVLQAPYFSKDYPEYISWGGAASLTGHELTHAFDNAGRQFDETGKLRDWWSKETIERYNNLTQCIVDQYAKYYVTGPDGKRYHVRSHLTLGEDIADAGGLAQVFRAWQDRFHSDKNGTKYDNYVLPGLNYTREQLFYIQFARGWARNIKPAESVRRIRTDEHSPTKYRVIGPLSNDENFLKAFKCPAGSRMNRKHKCKVW